MVYLTRLIKDRAGSYPVALSPLAGLAATATIVILVLGRSAHVQARRVPTSGEELRWSD